MWVLIGWSYDDVAIPCMFWNKKEDALTRCREIFQEVEEKVVDDKHIWEDEYEFDYRVTSQLFTGYFSDGLGQCLKAELREIKEGKKFIAWHLTN